jgi:hypothetical protein
MAGFGAVPDELRQVAGKIGETGDQVAGMVWVGPSGDYGHAGVSSAFEQFIEEMKQQVGWLREQVDGHALGLGEVARNYHDLDDQGRVDFTGVSSSEEAHSFINPEVSRRLFGGTPPNPLDPPENTPPLRPLDDRRFGPTPSHEVLEEPENTPPLRSIEEPHGTTPLKPIEQERPRF